jgi:hypothetical protein
MRALNNPRRARTDLEEVVALELLEDRALELHEVV